MTKKDKFAERDLPEIYIGNEKIVPRDVPLELNEDNWRKLEEEIERIRALNEKESEE